MTAQKTQDCTACKHREPHPTPTHQGQIWYCNQNKLWVGDRVTNCRHFFPATSDPAAGPTEGQRNPATEAPKSLLSEREAA